MGGLSPWHLAIAAGVFVLLFGSKKLPDAARSMGRSLRIFKSEIQELRDEPTTPPTAVVTPPQAAIEAPPAPVAAPAPVAPPAPLAKTPAATPDDI